MTQAVSHKTPSIAIIGASAGTGKTTRLVKEFIDAVTGSNGRAPIDPTRIIVCTFTNKAADELAARIRRELLRAGKIDEAQLVLAGYVGTVNGVCGRLLKDYALECGLSPAQTVVPEHMQNELFSLASASVADKFAERIEQVAERLNYAASGKKAGPRQSVHWLEHVRKICDFARANGMSANSLRESARRSWEEISAFFGTADLEMDADALDARLSAELERVVGALRTTNDSTVTTKKALDELVELADKARRKKLTWRDWVALQKINVSKPSKDIVKSLLELLEILPHHIRLHQDVKTYIEEVFECAVESIAAYQEYKANNGLVDFVDQECLALRLLDNPAVQESLRSRLDLALIDEFQDTSPIQLALFLKLAAIVNHSIWVGDIKQAIYGFRGTDPALMQKSAQSFNRLPPLEESYRSRPELVKFSNEIFRHVFPTYGIAEEDVVIRAAKTPAPSSAPVFEIWQCQGGNGDEAIEALGTAVAAMFDREQRMIEDPHTKVMRPLRGADVAILCRTNSHCESTAVALARRGLKVAMTRAGLLNTPECLLAIAMLRYLVDPKDKLALGYITFLRGNYAEHDQSQWLEQWLLTDNKDQLLQNHAQLEEARTKLGKCSILDAVSLAVSSGQVLETLERWGDVSQRMANLDALCGLVREYEEFCAMARQSCTLTGFIVYLQGLEDSAQPASMDDDAIKVLTYHAAKGLEWPVVVLADLDDAASPKVQRHLCTATVESDDQPFDINDPLRGRWIRFWPWPFGSIEKDLFFEPRALQSEQFGATTVRLRAENVRLMYVGITRARDCLILAPYARPGKPARMQWLEELASAEGPVLRLPADKDTDAPGLIWTGDVTHEAKFHVFTADDYVGAQTTKAVYSPEKPQRQPIVPLPYMVQPSSMTGSIGAELELAQTPIISIGQRIPVSGTVDMELLGNCIHAFLAADDWRWEQAKRLELARRVRTLWAIQHVENDALLQMSDQLRQFIETSFGKAIIRTECPVAARLGPQRLRGTIDLLVETPSALHIIDHKSFPGKPESWQPKALSYAPQLAAYKLALEQAADKPVEKLLVHMPVVGQIVDLTGACAMVKLS